MTVRCVVDPVLNLFVNESLRRIVLTAVVRWTFGTIINGFWQLCGHYRIQVEPFPERRDCDISRALTLKGFEPKLPI